MAAGLVHIPWYATALRADRLEPVLLDVSAASLRYGATWWQVHRSRDDRYKLLQVIAWDSKEDFDRWWASATPSKGIVFHSTGRTWPVSIRRWAFRHSQALAKCEPMICFWRIHR